MTHKIYKMAGARIYPLYIAKLVRKGRTQAELDELAKGRPMAKMLRQV